MRPSKKNLWARGVGLLSSLKLTLFLFTALAGTSVFGTVIQQQADPQAYIASYGPTWARVLQALGLADMYHSWWFELLLALLLANTVVCSLRRLPVALRAIRRRQFPEAEELGRKPLSASWYAAGEGAEAAVEAVLCQRFGRPRVQRCGQTATWFVQRMPWARLGAYLAHASLALFFLGGLVGARHGFKGFVNIVEGQSAGTIQLRNGGEERLPFEVACDAFELHTYPDGRPKDYLSRLTVRRDGQVLQEKTIEVNDPLIQDGIYFYQSSYGRAGGGAVLRILDRAGKSLGPVLRLAEDQAAPVPGTDLQVEVGATTENYNGFGPAAQLVLVAQGPASHAHVGEPFVVLRNFPEFDRRRGGDQIFQLAELLPGRWYTGLQVARDPGVPLVWAASVLLTLGTLLAFFASHRRLWVHLEDGRLTLAGSASKNAERFREAFVVLEGELRGRTETRHDVRRTAG